ncbi:MAG: A/G-specific adenine glycosylase [Planctomycetes bacterium]|nr:A/G-specific adenine glycosylase [Planctomycetota bacterium]
MARAPISTPGNWRQLRHNLLRWFRAHARPLPWRESRDPYAIWLSEVLLQQTQAATVVRYFGRFLRAFPSIAALASAEEQDLLRHWEGLGYYRRARDLLRAARLLVSHHDGRIPDDPEVLSRLPGFGRYTVGAVLSQAFDRRMPIVEANSRRVLSRLFVVSGASRNVEARLWELAEMLLPDGGAGDFNQALMELGALVCTARQPDCGRCPLAKACLARRTGQQESIPPRRGRAIIEKQVEVAVVCRRGQRVLVAQRPRHGRWAGMWEFPHGPMNEHESAVDAGRRTVMELTGCRADIGDPLLDFAHAITRFRIRLICLQARWRGGAFRSEFYQQGKWLLVEDLMTLPFSAPQRRLAATLSINPAAAKRSVAESVNTATSMKSGHPRCR